MEAIIEEYRQKFPRQGVFTFKQGQKIKDLVKAADVPNEYGVYIVFSPLKQVLYIGLSGTMLNNGSFKAQGLKKRLTNRQKKISRQDFFDKMLEEKQLNSLVFEWFITFDNKSRILPRLAESQLLQTYFNCNGKLPHYNDKA
jgi:hypothetical protein